MRTSPFDNLPPLLYEEALEILATPISDLKISSDYYKAAFHLAKYPGVHTENVLICLLKNKSLEQAVVIAQRKAIDTLAKLRCVRAIPIIGTYLYSNDPYLVENAALALKELDCKNVDLLEKMISLLDDPNQHRRALIKSITALGDSRALDKIRVFAEDLALPQAVRGASISALSVLNGEKDKLDELHIYLNDDNQNNRHCAFNDLLDSGDFKQLGVLLRAPISPSFRLTAIQKLWSTGSKHDNLTQLINLIDNLIIDDPREIDLSLRYQERPENSFLISELFSTDFQHCYLALRTLLGRETFDLWPLIEDVWKQAYKDYGAIYFLIQLFRLQSGWTRRSLLKIEELLFFSLSDSWPDYMKFRPISILLISTLKPDFLVLKSVQWLCPEKNPYWASRYAALMAIEKKLAEVPAHHIAAKLQNSLDDPNDFVRFKAENIRLKYC